MPNNHTNQAIAPGFILSCERSGSTLLRYIVDTHPMIAVPGRLDLGQLCSDMYTLVSRTTGASMGSADAIERGRIIHGEVRRIVGGLMDQYAIAKQKRMWYEKTAMNLDYLDIINSVFPDAKYICLYRNAMDVVHSCIEAGRLGFMTQHIPYVHQHPGNIVAAMVQSWIEKTKTLRAFEQAHRARCFHITYEEYVLRPAETLAPMFAFLGVEWDAGLLDRVFSSHHDPGDGDTKIRFATRIHHDSIGKGSTINRRLIPEHLLNEMNMLLTELGYPIVGPDWDTSPSPYSAMVQAAPAPEPYQTQGNIQEGFANYLQERINEATADRQGPLVVYKVVVTGDGGGSWKIDLTDSPPRISAGDDSADCTLTLAAPDLLAIINGSLNPAEAWMQGRLHIAGDLTQAEQLGRILFKRAG